MHAFNMELTKQFQAVSGNGNKDAFWAAKDVFCSLLGATYPDILETCPVVPNDGTLACSLKQWDTLRKHLVVCGFSMEKSQVESVVLRLNADNKNVIELFHVEYDMVNQTEFFPLSDWRDAIHAAHFRLLSKSSSLVSGRGMSFEMAALLIEEV
jgi:hypothetical protein